MFVDGTGIVDSTGVGDDTAGIVVYLASAVVPDSTAAVVGNCTRVRNCTIGADGTRVGDCTTGEVGNSTAVANVTGVGDGARVDDGTDVLDVAGDGDGSAGIHCKDLT